MATTTRSLIPCCGHCGRQEGLLRCSGCKAIQYCGRDHQAADRPAHKFECKKVQKSCSILQAEEQRLRAHPGDMFTPSDVFESSVGYFWGIFETRGYMRARYALVEELLKINTFAATQSALDHLRAMLRLCPGDNMGVRNLVPAISLRLGREQECYDFVKWQMTEGQDSNYDWGNGLAPFLDVANADVFEPVDHFCSKYLPSLSFTLAVTLLKIKLLLDLKDLQNATELRRKLPTEIVHNVKIFLPRTSIISNNKSILMCTDHTARINELSSQVEKLYVNMQNYSPHMWRMLVEPGRLLETRPHTYSPGSKEEAHLALGYSYESWNETPGAFEIIAAKVRDSKR